MIVQCSYGHHYDNSIFSDGCPQCKQLGLVDRTSHNPEFGLNEDVSMSEFEEMPVKSSSAAPPKMNNTGGKTIGYFNPEFPSRDIKTESGGNERSTPSMHSVSRSVADPVVGWLVCIKGINFGKSFPLFYGRNFIGRNDDNDVCLRGEQTVSKEKHAIIMYEPKLRKYYATDGESHSIYYVNNEVVMGNISLNSHDIIEIGAAKLLFIPLCNEKFGWDDEELLK